MYSIRRIIWDGELIPYYTGFERRLATIREWDVPDDVIFVTSYPKAGTHWMMKTINILLDAQRKCDGDVDTRVLDSQDFLTSWPFLEEMEGNKLASPIRPSMVVCTHLPRRLLPVKIWENNKIIHLIRSPKDTAVSLYHFQKARGVGVGTFEQFLQRFTNGEGAYGSWFDKELDWWTHERQNPNVLFMSYEERIKAPEESVRKVIRFLDLENLPMDDNFLQNVVKRTSFESMKNEDGRTLTKGLAMQTGTFCRKGQVGDWKNYFTVKQNEDFDKKFFEKMKETDLAVMFK